MMKQMQPGEIDERSS
jgi:hypothetical protein